MMKKIFLLVLVTFISFACKQETKKESVKKEETKISYPKALGEVFEKHGGIKAWKQARTLSFGVNNEEHTVDLPSRKTVINAKEYTLGYDGTNVWLHQQDSTAFTKNPEFYFNLYFYFYAMPFVLADNGIIYEETSSLEFKAVKYPGFKISYKANVGTSPDDNYYVYYDAKTKEMSWLAYTVTYFSKEATNNVSLIRYNDWENVNGFLLPKSITWYQKDADGNPTEPARDPLQFKLPLISKAPLADSFFEKPKQ